MAWMRAGFDSRWVHPKKHLLTNSGKLPTMLGSSSWPSDCGHIMKGSEGIVMCVREEQSHDSLNRVGVQSATLERVIRNRRMFPSDMPAIQEIAKIFSGIGDAEVSRGEALRMLAVIEPLTNRLDEFEEEDRKIPLILANLHEKVKNVRELVDKFGKS